MNVPSQTSRGPALSFVSNLRQLPTDRVQRPRILGVRDSPAARLKLEEKRRVRIAFTIAGVVVFTLVAGICVLQRDQLMDLFRSAAALRPIDNSQAP